MNQHDNVTFQKIAEEGNGKSAGLNEVKKDQTLPTISTSVSARNFLKLDLPPRRSLIVGLIPEQGRVMVYGPRGIGKTHFALWLSVFLALGIDFLIWRIKRPKRVVYLDGEMDARDLRKRLEKIAEQYPDLKDTSKLRLLPLRLYEGIRPDLETESGQKLLTDCIPERTDLVVIDNLSSWTVSGREDAIAWASIERWIQMINRRGAAVLIVHHSGKRTGTQRGTSKREDQVEVIAALRPVSNSVPSDGAKFQVWIEKGRELIGDAKKPFQAELVEGPTGQEWLTYEIETSDALAARIKRLKAKGLSVTQIAQRVGRNKSTVSRYLSGQIG